jgi:hypothetical protein
MSELRAIAFVCCTAFIALAPGYRELVGGSLPVPRWQMFSGIALDLYRVKFESSADGKRQDVDRYALLGYENPLKAPRWVRLIRSESEAYALASRLCRRLGSDAELYMHLDDATRLGWRSLNDGTGNVCAMGFRARGPGQRK